jgi:hypothetical protein
LAFSDGEFIVLGKSRQDMFNIPEAWKLMKEGLFRAAEGKRIAVETGAFGWMTDWKK